MTTKRFASLPSLPSLCGGVRGGTPTEANNSTSTPLPPLEAREVREVREGAILSTNPALTSTESASLKARQHPNLSFTGYILEQRKRGGKVGSVARSVARDKCWPKDGISPASKVDCFTHLRNAHTDIEDFIDTLQQVFVEWVDEWSHSDYVVTYDRPTTRPRQRTTVDFPERPPILEAAADSGLDVSYNEMAFCWNDVPGSPTQGHFGGNKERSMKLYADNDTFECHQCGIWGYSDQLMTRTWQGRK